MKLYNTLTREIDEIKPIRPPQVTVYTCGPTVYDYPHIGNWFTFIRYDLLIRAIKVSDLKPRWIMNITDVGHLVSDADEGEDKLEKGAQREGKSAWDIAKFYTDYFVDGLERLNITPPDKLPRATAEIPAQIALIQKLEAKGFTYTISDGVYFDTGKLNDYGKLARLDIAHLQAGARVAINPEKRHQTDFALWKFSPKDKQRDMEWDSPWGKGFPGWHLECSAMACSYLGETIDIHAGGIDHIPVHHTNEIAQSEAATGKPFAHYWMHVNHILVDGKKISKSSGNGITLEQIKEKGFDLAALRLLVLESHYRSQAHFSWENLEAAHNRLRTLEAVSDLRFQAEGEAMSLGKTYFTEKQKAFKEALQNDLDTPAALRIISEVVADLERFGLHVTNANGFNDFLALLDHALGLDLLSRRDLTPEQVQLYQTRQKARDAKDWQTSDQLRDQLKEQGIAVSDTPAGQVWSRL